MNSTERRVLENVRKLDKLEREFLKFTYETSKPQTHEEFKVFLKEALRTAWEAFHTKNSILEDFRDLSELTIQDQQALRLLDSIRREDKLYSIAFLENVSETLGEMIESGSDTIKISTSLDDILDYKFDDLLLEFHSCFDVLGYYSAKIMIGPIIASSKSPSYLLSYFDELKETYAFGQYRASIALCRALLEMALYKRLKAKGSFKDQNPKVTSIDVAKENNLSRYINMAKRERILSKQNCEVAHGIRKAANKVLHIKDNEKTLDHKIVVDSIFSTLRILEELHR